MGIRGSRNKEIMHARTLSIRVILITCTLLMENMHATAASNDEITQMPTVAKTDDKGNATRGDLSRLLVDLFSTYDSSLGPRMFLSDKAEVNITIEPYLLYEMDTAEQTIRVAITSNVNWIDEILVWDPELYGGIRSLTLPLNKIWYPKVTVAADIQDAIDEGTQTVMLMSSGQANMFFHGQIRFPCAVDVTYYPFDTQKCTLTWIMSPLSIPVSTLRLVQGQNIPKLFHENSEWQLLDFTSTMKKKGTHELITCDFLIRRRAAFNVYTLIAPLVALSILNCFTVLVPISSGDKGSIAITIFLAYGFFAGLSRDTLPHNSLQISSYVIYICVLLLISMVTCVYVMVQSRIYLRRDIKENVSVSCSSWTVHERCNEIKKEDTYTMTSKIRGKDKKLTCDEMLCNLDIFAFFVLMLMLIILNLTFWLRVVINGQV